MGISEEILVLDSEEVDTFDTLLFYEDIEESTSESTNENFNNLEKISLDSIAYNYETEVYFNDDTENDDTEIIIEEDDNLSIETTYNSLDNNFINLDTVNSHLELDDFEIFKNELLEPLEILENLENLREKSKNTLKTLKELKTICEQAIIDIEHKIEFEQFTISEGYNYSLLIKELRIKRRFIKNTLDKYDSVSQTLNNLDKSFGKSFIKNQIKTLNKISNIQSNRQYTPRILKNLEVKGKACQNHTLDSLEIEISSLLENANM